MRNQVLGLCALTLLPLAHPAQELEEVIGASEEPVWMWSRTPSPTGDVAWFQRSFSVPAGPDSAELYVACDNEMSVWLDGERLFTHGEWTRPVLKNVKSLLGAGEHRLAIRALNTGGPAGLYVELRLRDADGVESVLGSGADWVCTDVEPDGFEAADYAPGDGWREPIFLGPMGVSPWGSLGAGQGPPREGATPGDELELPDGFQAELLYSVPKASQGSWVSMTFDGQGRIIASDQYGSLYRVSLPALGEQGVEVESLEVEAANAQGMLWAHDSLYVVENSGNSGLWRLRDLDGDDQFESVERMVDFQGSGEHGPHAILEGPEGDWLYLIAGNHVDLPDYVEESRVPRVWAEDQLLERRPDPNGHANGRMAPGGWVARFRPDGTQWELIACGLRNAYDIAFNPAGDLFTFDADMEWDVGLPWYRPTRVNHLVSGADFGWRHGSGKWPAYFADSLPASVDIGLSSPTGIVFGTHARFPRRWQDALYVQDWSYGTIYAVHLEPEGASYTGSFEPFVVGRPLPVTDMDVGPDGAMYFTVGGRRTQSGLYRVTWTGELDADESERPVEPSERRVRELLEVLHGHEHPRVIEAAFRYLGHEDRFVRHAARTALEHQDADSFADRALHGEDEERAVVNALIALVRTGPEDVGAQVLQRIERMQYEGWEAEPLLELLRLYQLTFTRTGRPAAGVRARLGARLAGLYPNADPRANKELCRLLVYLEEPGVVAATLPYLDHDTPEQRLYYAWQLRHVARGWTRAQSLEYFAWIDGALAELRGGNSFAKYLHGMRDDALALLDAETLAAVEEARANSAAEARPASTREPRPFVRAWTMAELEPLLEGLTAERNLARGRELYAATSCFDCHRFAGEGGGPGTDLTGAGGRFSGRDLLEALLEPSATISDQYQDTAIVLSDDTFLVGRIESEADGWLILNEAPHGERSHEIALADIVERAPHPVSRMPAGLLDTLQSDELLDLMAFVLSGSNDAADGGGE